jgi:hypothetical protein
MNERRTAAIGTPARPRYTASDKTLRNAVELVLARDIDMRPASHVPFPFSTDLSERFRSLRRCFDIFGKQENASSL